MNSRSPPPCCSPRSRQPRGLWLLTDTRATMAEYEVGEVQTERVPGQPRIRRRLSGFLAVGPRAVGRPRGRLPHRHPGPAQQPRVHGRAGVDRDAAVQARVHARRQLRAQARVRPARAARQARRALDGRPDGRARARTASSPARRGRPASAAFMCASTIVATQTNPSRSPGSTAAASSSCSMWICAAAWCARVCATSKLAPAWCLASPATRAGSCPSTASRSSGSRIRSRATARRSP